ncbi:hypothetical protein [Prevotella sp.]
MNNFMKRLTISSVTQSMCYGLAALLLTTSCANGDLVQEEKEKKIDIPTGATIFTGTSQPNVTTRTAILNHTKGSGASVNWSSGDKIWVKDNAGAWQQSGSVNYSFETNKSQGAFALSGTYTGDSHDIVYTNVSVTGSQPQVQIKATQKQSAPNNFDHAGASGDCGIAKANKVGSDYKFTLDHKASYLCFIPRTSNEYVKRSKLFKVEIMSDDDIAGTYNIADDGTLTLASGGSKTITVTTGSGFDIDNAADDMSKNATYAVVAPGTHTFRIRYWLRNTTDNPAGKIEGTVSKIVTLDCTAGSIHDITANLNPHDYAGNKYYMWDAKKNYWADHEWNSTGDKWQPVKNNDNNTNFPKSSDRYFNTIKPMTDFKERRKAATNSCVNLPDLIEMTWYCFADPRWDDNELWTTMGHLYKGGMWFKKKDFINGYSSDETFDKVDWSNKETTQTWKPVSAILPSLVDVDKYFYVPALGYYDGGTLYNVGIIGYCWSTTLNPVNNNQAYYIFFRKNDLNVGRGPRRYGFSLEGFQ